MSTYVYGVVHASRPLPEGVMGIGEPPLPVRAVRDGELAALVSDAPPELRAKRRDLLAHQRVVAGTGGSGPVLPLRFGAIAPDDAAVAAILREHRERYLERLAALDGKDEFNVKVTHDEEAVLLTVLRADPVLRERHRANRAADGGSSGERIAFGELVAGAVARQGGNDAELVERALIPHAAGLRTGPAGGDRVANLSFLVEHAHRAEFLAAAQRLDTEQEHLRVQVTGPLPPYSFADTE
jgi:hypothetical protein